MIQVGREFYLRGYQYRKSKSIWLEARSNEKIAIKLKNNLVVSGIISRVGTKNITLEIGQRLFGKTITYTAWRIINLEDIETFAKYPKGFQVYGSKKLY